MAYGNIIVPQNPAPLPGGLQAGAIRRPPAQSIWPGMTTMQTAGGQEGDTPPPPPPLPWSQEGPYTPPPPMTTPQPPPVRTEEPWETPGAVPGPWSPPPMPSEPGLPGGPDLPDGTRPPAPPQPGPRYWSPDINSYMQQMLSWLNSQRDAWQQQYRGLGNTGTSWVDWASQRYTPEFSQWMMQNFRAPTGYAEGSNIGGYRTQLEDAFKNWLGQNSVNYTNPTRLPMRNRMQVPVTDWTRLAGPDQGIPSGFSERATASPWTADYRGGAFGPTGRLPSWTTQGTPPMTPKLGGAW